MLARPRFTITALALVSVAFVPACKKGSRAKLEGLVPDGATVVVSFEMQPLAKSAGYGKLFSAAKDTDPKVEAAVTKLTEACELDSMKIEHLVLGFDALSQGVMAAVVMPNIGKVDSLKCVNDLVKELKGEDVFAFSVEDGRTKLEIDGGKTVAWAVNDNTLVLSTKGWASAVKQRINDEGKAAVDSYLKDAVGLTDRSAHIWIAGEIPPLAKPFLADTPGEGLQRAAMSMGVGDELGVTWSVVFAEESQATALKKQAEEQVAATKPAAIEAGIPAEAFDSFELTVDGSTLSGKVKVPFTDLVDKSTAALDKYIARSKTAEAKLMVFKIWDAASMYFNQEHTELGALTPTPHRCPALPGKTSGSSGIVPPLSVDCSKGPGGNCVPVVGGSDKPGHYAAEAWTDNTIFKALNFELNEGHAFHYEFRYTNDTNGYGACQFTVQAFGDLDGDGVFSTYAREGKGDESGTHGVGGLKVEQELE